MQARWDPLRVFPVLAIHGGCFLAWWTGVSPAAVAACVVLYIGRALAISVGYHRYFAHRSFQTSRWFQALLALAASSAGQNGPLWWAGHHRAHHELADTEQDLHSPRQGWWWAHMGWFLSKKYEATNTQAVSDWAVYPELRWLNTYHYLPPFGLIAVLFALGAWLEIQVPSAGTSGAQLVVWGFCFSTVLLYHAAGSILSLAHLIGRRRYPTEDDSRNSFLLSLIFVGEGWHNNHHAYPLAARRGFFWWEFDPGYYLIKCLGWLGLVWDIHEPPARFLRSTS